MEPVVTVGLDGSAESLSAARWAAAEAHRRGTPLRLLHAWVLLSSGRADDPGQQEQNHWARRIVSEAREEVQALRPGLPVIEDLVADQPGRALLKASEESGTLVLGTRGLDSVESFFLGDISLHVVSRAPRPVVLVRADAPEGRPEPVPADSRVVVGLELQGPCDPLLEFAFTAAAGRGVPLYALHARSMSFSARAPGGGAGGRPGGVAPQAAEEVTKAARADMEAVLRPWAERFPDVPLAAGVRLTSPAKAVVKAARDAGLLVIGRRGHRRALGPRMGAVAHAAVHHAACPVAVVPAG